ncbi:MAG: hypothetical protein LH630_07510, partial [Actinomycetia bacterium]|nr:hypothetical protein [Actinomycetes bacterium]
MTDTHPTIPLPNEPERSTSPIPDLAAPAAPATPTAPVTSFPLPPQNPWAAPAPVSAPAKTDSSRR